MCHLMKKKQNKTKYHNVFSCVISGNPEVPSRANVTISQKAEIVLYHCRKYNYLDWLLEPVMLDPKRRQDLHTDLNILI